MSNIDTNPSPKLRGPFVRRVWIRNYKSIEKCAVDLKPLTVLVGRNGAGKSNFLDALSFITDGLRTSLDHAINTRAWRDGRYRPGVARCPFRRVRECARNIRESHGRDSSKDRANQCGLDQRVE